MIKLLRFMKPYRWLLVLVVLFAFGQAIANLYLPTLMADIIDNGIIKNDIGYIWRTGGIMALVAIGGTIFTMISIFISSRVATGFGKIIRAKLFTHVQKFSLHEFDTVGTASLITRTTNDTTQVQQMLVIILNMMITAPITMVAGIILALNQDVGLSWILVVDIPVLVAAILILMSKAIPLFRLIQVKLDKLNLILDEGLTGVRVVRAFDRQKYEEQRFDVANRDLTDISIRVNRIVATLMPLMMFIMLPRSAASATRINEVLEIEPEINDAEQVKRADEMRGYVEFDDVTFSYPGAEEPALSHISFSARPGEVTAIIGGT